MRTPCDKPRLYLTRETSIEWNADEAFDQILPGVKGWIESAHQHLVEGRTSLTLNASMQATAFGPAIYLGDMPLKIDRQNGASMKLETTLSADARAHQALQAWLDDARKRINAIDPSARLTFRFDAGEGFTVTKRFGREAI